VPEAKRLRAALRTALASSGLLPLARRVREMLWARQFVRGNREYLKNGSPDGLPVPPLSLRVLVAASPDVAWFFESGRRSAESIRTTLERNGIDLRGTLPILDFGCGCGRTVRHFAALGGAVHGTDLNPRLIAWCRHNLAFGRFETNALEPPLPFEDDRFGLIYALSVFTHLPESLQTAWMDELRRLLRPGGYLVFTTHGTRYTAELDARQRDRFAAGHLVMERDDRAGSNVCGAYHPEAYVRQHLSRGFTVVDFVPEGAIGNPWQDLWLLQRS
jgi:SAM-dependent methyltransferase